MTIDSKAPIGIFDSGQGGVSTLGQAAFMLPFEKLIYFGDSGVPPYSLMEKSEVHKLCLTACDFLVQKGVKAIVVACNTATAVALTEMRRHIKIPILGMEPAIKVAADWNLPGQIVIMATGMMLKSQNLKQLIKRVNRGKEIVKLACRDVITLVEAGVIDGTEMEKTIAKYFEPLDSNRISSVVLGCTHFGFLETAVKKVVGTHIEVADGNTGTIHHLKNILARSNMLRPETGQKPVVEIYNSAGNKFVDSAYNMLQRHVIELQSRT